MAKKQIVTESLIAFCARAEADAQPLTVCRVTHPDAIDGDTFEGTYSGYPLVKDSFAEALLSDGSFYPPRPEKAETRAAPVEPETAADPAPEGGAA